MQETVTDLHFRLARGLVVAGNAAPSFFPLYLVVIIALDGSWPTALTTFLATMVVAFLLGLRNPKSSTVAAVERALWWGRPGPVSWALVDTEAKRRLSGPSPRFSSALAVAAAVAIVLADLAAVLEMTVARGVGAVLLVGSWLAAAAAVRVARRQATRWLAAGHSSVSGCAETPR